jgi:hypothetical protein
MTLKSFLIVGLVGLSALILAQSKPESTPTDPLQFKQVKLYPNPATEYLTVKFEAPVAKDSKFTLHNIIGNELETETEVVDDYEVKIKVKDLSSGFYLLLVRHEQLGLKGAYKFLKR